MSQTPSLNDLRERIDSIDEQLLKLLTDRAQCAEDVAIAKRADDPDAKFYRPEREAFILNRMIELNAGPLRNEQVTRIYREVISSCLALEESLTIAYLGPEGTFTQEATRKHFGSAIGLLPVESIADVFREVESGRVRYGVVPIENSTEGVVSHTLDTFVNSRLKICSEVVLRVHQNLLSKREDWQEAKRVYSHAQSLAQCRGWLDKHLPKAERIPCSSNAEAARIAAEDETAVAIASLQAAPIYGLKVAEASIEDNSHNTTRFLVVGNQEVAPCGRDKTSLMLSTPNRPGALYQLLKPLAEHGIDMSRIESRPSRNNNWEYYFFLDIGGHEQDEHVQQALAVLREQVDLVRVLGSYPIAVM